MLHTKKENKKDHKVISGQESQSPSMLLRWGFKKIDFLVQFIDEYFNLQIDN